MSDVQHTAALLIEARRSRTPTAAPEVPDAEHAYAVQSAVARVLGWFDDCSPRHWNSGGPSRQAVPTHAPLPEAGVFESPGHLGHLPLQLRGIEAEIALRLREPVTAAMASTLDENAAAALVDAMCVSIEVVDSRWREGTASPRWAKLADQQLHGALVLGQWLPCVARDWSAQVCRVRIGAQPEQVFRGSHTLGDPLAVLPAWLRHATRDGQVFRASTVVTSGAWCGLLMAGPGDAVEVAFDGIGAAQLSF
ncbi:MAG: fumarylacetoacetate hydrolase family protein [Rubrivivax sp.]